MPSERERDKLGLPPRIFFYTVEQIATMLELESKYVMSHLLFFADREAGIPPRNKMRAVNVAGEGETPIWRVSEQALVAFLKYRGVKFYYRGFA